MARTRQTARRSYNYSSDAQSSQVAIFRESSKRTITVEGTAEFCETPDSISLSFLIEEVASSLSQALKGVIAKLTSFRSIANSCGVLNENISSDSIGSSIERTNYRESADDSTAARHKSRIKKIRIEYRSRSVARIFLEGKDATTLFSKVSFALILAGFRTHRAPIYESTKITEHRNVARKEACENAKQKALFIVNSLQDETVKLGPPIALTDVQCDVKNDAQISFLGNAGHTTDIFTESDDDGGDDDDDDWDNCERETKKTRLDDLNRMDLDEDSAVHIFVAPPITIAARVKAIFELTAVPSEE